MNKPIHVAITWQVKPGHESEVQHALHEFLLKSFTHAGVQGVSMLFPMPVSPSSEIGGLLSFASFRERDAFYASLLFRTWEDRIKALIEGEPVYREMHRQEVWPNSPQNPPAQWKMALLTWIAVWPISTLAPAVLNPLIGSVVPQFAFAGAVAGVIVLVLTWVAMPLLVKVANGWLQPGPQSTKPMS